MRSPRLAEIHSLFTSPAGPRVTGVADRGHRLSGPLTTASRPAAAALCPDAQHPAVRPVPSPCTGASSWPTFGMARTASMLMAQARRSGRSARPRSTESAENGALSKRPFMRQAASSLRYLRLDRNSPRYVAQRCPCPQRRSQIADYAPVNWARPTHRPGVQIAVFCGLRTWILSVRVSLAGHGVCQSGLSGRQPAGTIIAVSAPCPSRAPTSMLAFAAKPPASGQAASSAVPAACGRRLAQLRAHLSEACLRGDAQRRDVLVGLAEHHSALDAGQKSRGQVGGLGVRA